MLTRISQLLARYIGLALATIAAWIIGNDISAEQQATIADLANGIALAVVAAIMFIVDLVLHRLQTGALLRNAGKSSMVVLLCACGLTMLMLGGCQSLDHDYVRHTHDFAHLVGDEYIGYVEADDSLTVDQRDARIDNVRQHQALTAEALQSF